ARMIQLGLEYDPQPPFDSGTPEKAGAQRVSAARAVLAPSLPRIEAEIAEAAQRLKSAA
ncbi:MAG: ThiJ/PfpI domain protein, partial [Polaromonas sp.]|nr:ThiJ/PfpI domain protein [Polaromonas sp.]